MALTKLPKARSRSELRKSAESSFSQGLFDLSLLWKTALLYGKPAIFEAWTAALAEFLWVIGQEYM